MASSDDLTDFVREALRLGLARPQIEAALRQAGWSAEQVQRALNAYADVDFPIPVPRPAPYLSARDAFLYLLLFTTLYLSAYHLGQLLFVFIERAFPDPAMEPYGLDWSQTAIRWSVSYLVIAFPLFLFVARLLGRAVRRDPTKRASKVRKWLTYLTLFVAAGVLIGDLTVLVYNLLGGELTVRFILKVLVVAAIAGSIFGYYLRDLREDEREDGV